MKKYETREENPKTGYVTIRTFIERITNATPKSEIKGWQKGQEYEVIVSPIGTKFCIYKRVGPWSEPSSGYKTYPSIEAIQSDFDCKTNTEQVSMREEKIVKKPQKFNI
jgi:hypothetical protein